VTDHPHSQAGECRSVTAWNRHNCAWCRVTDIRLEAVDADNATWMYRSIFAGVGNQPDAQDLTAQVFLAALRPLRLTATVAEVRARLRAVSAPPSPRLVEMCASLTTMYST
jgi:hypothetical protein